MGDANPIYTLGDYSKPSHKGYKNTIELPVGNNVVPLRSNTIRLVQNGCSLHELWFEDSNQHLKDFLNLVDSLYLDGEHRERTHLYLFQFSHRDQASNWLKRLPVGSITTWEDLTTHFLAQFFLPERTAKLCNDILMFQQHQGESLSEAWTCFKDLLQKLSHHSIDLWLQVQSFMTMSISPQDDPLTNRLVLDDTPIRDALGNPAEQMNFTSTNDPTREGLRGKGIKSPSKLLSLKYLSCSSLAEQNRNPSSPKRVHFIILNKEDESKENRNVKTSTIEYEDREMTVEI
nr:zinc finger, CCHC-type [Tanacetum cinerariifolium]